MRTGAGALPAPAGLPAFSGNRAPTGVRSSATEEGTAAIRQASVGKITSSATAFKESTAPCSSA